MLRQYLVFCLFVLPILSYAQDQPDFIVVRPRPFDCKKEWTDKNGNNLLQIHVSALCTDNLTFMDGFKSKITVTLNNKKHDLKKSYDNENYQMSSISFYEQDIILEQIDGSTAVFVPFFYCGNMDSSVTVSYFIFYNKYKYIKHISFYCSEDGDCKLNDDIDKKLKGMPDVLKNCFLQQLSKYKLIGNFHQEW